MSTERRGEFHAKFVLLVCPAPNREHRSAVANGKGGRFDRDCGDFSEKSREHRVVVVHGKERELKRKPVSPF